MNVNEETMACLCRESEKEETELRALLYEAAYVRIKSIKSGFRRILAQIPVLPFVSCEQVI